MGVEPAYQTAGQSSLVYLPVGSQKRLSVSLKCHWAGQSTGRHLSTHLLRVGLKASTGSGSVGISELSSTWCVCTLQRAFDTVWRHFLYTWIVLGEQRYCYLVDKTTVTVKHIKMHKTVPHNREVSGPEHQYCQSSQKPALQHIKVISFDHHGVLCRFS